MTNRQKFWIATTISVLCLGAIGGALGHFLSWPGVLIGMLLGAVVGRVAASVMPLEWRP